MEVVLRKWGGTGADSAVDVSGTVNAPARVKSINLILFGFGPHFDSVLFP